MLSRSLGRNKKSVVFLPHFICKIFWSLKQNFHTSLYLKLPKLGAEYFDYLIYY